MSNLVVDISIILVNEGNVGIVSIEEVIRYIYHRLYVVEKQESEIKII